jgi:hypothetical protein
MPQLWEKPLTGLRHSGPLLWKGEEEKKKGKERMSRRFYMEAVYVHMIGKVVRMYV